MEEEIASLRRDVEQTRSKSEVFSNNIKTNESELRIEEAKLSSTRHEFNRIRDQIRLLESQQEPEPTDVIALVRSFHLQHIFILIHICVLSYSSI